VTIYPWSLIYPISASASLLLSLSMLLKNRGSSIYQQFFVYGFLSFIYLLIGFYTINASNKEDAISAFGIATSIYFISIGLFSYLVKSLVKESSENWIILVGSMIAAPLSLLPPREEPILTDFGWVIKGKVDTGIINLILLAFLIFYFVFTGMNIFMLLKRARIQSLKQKYFLIFGSFMIQFVVIFGLTVFMSLSDIVLPHLSGLLQFVSLTCIWNALRIKVPKDIEMSSTKVSRAAMEKSDLSESYRKFLNKFLKVVATDDMGIKVLDFLEYLDKTRLSDVVTYDKLRVILKAESIESVDNIQALDRTIEYLENKTWGNKLAQSFIDVLEGVFQNIQDDTEKREAFKSVLIKHQDFLKKSDVIYGLMGGQLLELMQSDSSLCELPEWSAILRFYVRLLLPLRHFISGPIKGEFMLKMRSTDVTKFIDVSENGDIDIESASNYVTSLPEKRKLEAVKESFNILLVWTMQRLAESDPSAYADYLRTIRRVTKLNAEAKGIWRAYFSLVDRATKELGRARIRDLVLSEGYSYADLEAFSSPLGLSHDALVRNIVTLEYDPRYPYEHYVSSAMREVLANTERCVLFTRLGSRVLEVAKDLGDVELKVMTTIGTIEEGIPFNDTSKLLDIVGRELESELATWIVFDNISDLVLAVGFDEAYVFARRVIDLVSSKGASLLLLMNKGAHSTEVMRTFEGLSTRIVEAAERLRLIR